MRSGETEPGPWPIPIWGCDGTARSGHLSRTASPVYEGTAGLRTYRKACAETCAIFALEDPRRFGAQCRIYHLESAVLTDMRSSSLQYLRSARHVAGGAYDHYQVTFDVRRAPWIDTVLIGLATAYLVVGSVLKLWQVVRYGDLSANNESFWLPKR